MKSKSESSGRELRAGTLVLRRTLIIMVVCGIVAFLVLAGKLYKLQIKDHKKYEDLAVDQQTRETVITANRGTIYDSNMKILAMSASAETVFISPRDFVEYDQDIEFIAKGLSEILDVSYESIIEKTADTKSQYKTIRTKIEQELADKVREFKNDNKLRGIYIVPDTKRYYPYNSLAASVIGFVGTDNTGLNGLEAKYDSSLQGVNGRIVTAKNSAGTDMLFTKFEDYYDATNGGDHILTINSTVQYYLEKNLETAIEDYDIQNGAMGIVMDVNTGAVLAMANMPGYDLNNYQEVNEAAKKRLEGLTGEEYSASLSAEQFKQWRNRTISDTYEPGSTFKIITLAIGIEEGVVSENDHFYCSGSMNVLGRKEPLHCWKTAGHGDQTLAESAQHSCNVAFVNIGLKIGAPTFYDYIEAFGFFDKTGIDLPSETSGLWWSESVFEQKDNLSQLASASFGQTFTITPLQLITAVSAVANGGYLMEPYIVQRIQDPDDGSIIYEHTPKVVRQVISEETSQRVCTILESVVGTSEGTGKNAYVAGYRIAGKTGTSTNTVLEAEQNVKEYKVSFIGFAPADDPQVAVLVILDNPSKNSGIYISGGVMAAPTVGNIFSEILPYLDVETVYSEEELALKDVAVPGVRGASVSEAKEKLESAGFDVRVSGSGDTVTDQMPAANAIIANGSQVIIYAEEEKPQGNVVMPDLTGLTINRARERLQEYGLYMSTAGVTDTSSTVIATKQSIAAGENIARGSVIEVTFMDFNQSIMETG